MLISDFTGENNLALSDATSVPDASVMLMVLGMPVIEPRSRSIALPVGS